MKHLGWGHAIGAVSLALVFGSAALITSSPAQAATVWLCKPGLKSNPCAVSMGSTALYADRTTRTDSPTSPKSPRVDCFYVYPTVSNQKTGNANLNIDPIRQLACFPTPIPAWRCPRPESAEGRRRSVDGRRANCGEDADRGAVRPGVRDLYLKPPSDDRGAWHV